MFEVDNASEAVVVLVADSSRPIIGDARAPVRRTKAAVKDLVIILKVEPGIGSWCMDADNRVNAG